MRSGHELPPHLFVKRRGVLEAAANAAVGLRDQRAGPLHPGQCLPGLKVHAVVALEIGFEPAFAREALLDEIARGAAEEFLLLAAPVAGG